MKLPQGEESAVIHHMKNYLLYKDAIWYNLWPCDFTDVTAFSSLFFLALHYCSFLYIFFHLWLCVCLFNFFTKFFFMVLLFFLNGYFLLWVPLSLAVSLASSAQFFLVIVFQHSVGHLSLLIGSLYGIFLGLLLPNFLFIVIVVFVLIDTWLGSFFFRVLLFTDCASVFHPAFLSSGSVLSSGL